MARKIAVDYLHQFAAREVYVYLAYAIGHPEPLEATAWVDGRARVVKGYDLTPGGISQALHLKQPIYEQTARYGHFGHAGFSWE